MVLRLLKDAFVSRKIESVHFCSYPQAKPSPTQKEIIHFTHTRFSEIFFHAETGEDYGAEKMTKLNLRGYWSQVGINSPIYSKL